MEDMKGKIRVYCRVRPILQMEKDRGQTGAPAWRPHGQPCRALQRRYLAWPTSAALRSAHRPSPAQQHSYHLPPCPTLPPQRRS